MFSTIPNTGRAILMLCLFIFIGFAPMTQGLMAQTQGEDDNPPVFTFVPADAVLACDEELVFGTPEAEDFESGLSDIVSVIATTGDDCNGSSTITWTASDLFGNIATASQTLSYSDTDAPVFTSFPADLIAECGDVPAPGASGTSGFTGNMAAENWTVVTGAADGSVTFTADEMVIVGPNNNTADEVAQAIIECPVDGPYAFDWSYTTLDGPNWDPAYFVNGEVFQLTDSEGDNDQSGSLSLNCVAGDIIGFGIITDDGAFGAPTLTISEFSVGGSAIAAEDDCNNATIEYLGEEVEEGDCGADYTLLRTWSATDDCGNSALYTQVIEVEDTMAPEFADCPEDVHVQCEGDVPAASLLVATDACEGDLDVSYFETDLSDPNSTICDLETPATTGTDFWAITLPGLPDGINPNFVWDANGAQLFVDGDDLLITGTVVNVEDPNYSFYVHFAADSRTDWDGWNSQLTTANPFVNRLYKDQAGFAAAGGDLWTTWEFFEVNSSDAYLAGQGELAGSFLTMSHAPTNYLFGVQLGEAANDKTADYGLSSWFFVNGTINCEDYSGQGDISTNADCNNPSTECAYDINRQWTAADSEGHVTTCMQTITVADTEGPELVCPADLTVECTESTEIANTGDASATDNCSSATISHIDGPVTGTCPASFERAWTAIDECGNTTECIQTISIDDTIAPELTIGADADISCDETVPAEESSATDNCDTDVVVTVETEEFPGNCPQESTIVRTYTATDDCDNTTVLVQTITISDDEAPVITPLEALITAECDAIPGPETLEAVDNCGNVTVTVVDQPFSGGCQGAFERTYTAADECGNTSVFTQVINVVDTTDPVLTVGADMTINCEDDLPAEEFAATDNCDDEVTIEMVPTIIDGDCPQAYTLVRTYTATDDCDNTTVLTQTITVIDETAPTIVAAADLTLECTDDVPAAFAETADNCDADVAYTVEETLTPACGVTYTLTRLYTATDDCGNTAQDTQIITVIDETAPYFEGIPADTEAECDNIDRSDVVDAIDVCDGMIPFDYEETVSNEECPGTYLLTRTWTATDACGNSAVATQLVYVSDTTAPEFGDLPADETVECDETPVAVTPVTATDNCDMAPVVTSEDVIIEGNCPSNYTIERTYTATDNCDNTASYTQTITVQDTTSPEFGALEPFLNVECDMIPEPSDIEATDNCGTATVTVEDAILSGGCQGAIQRTYTATDECGNTALYMQIINVVDNTAPVLDINPDATVECGADFDLAGATATDNCDDDVLVTSDSVFVADCGLTGVWTITYYATDSCGNSTEGTQTITIEDTTAPSITAAADSTIECNAALPAASADVSDICGTASYTVEESSAPTCGNTYILTRTYIATDACGNTATDEQIITVEDTTPPSITCLADVTASCDDNTSVAAIGMATGSDTCGEVEITWSNEVEPLCGGASIIYRTFVATDDCGNTASCTQTITKLDTTAPEFGAIEAFINVECDSIPGPADVTATDNCGDATVTVEDAQFSGGCQGAFERVYTATDECGNTALFTQIVNVFDNAAPVLSINPDATVECGEDFDLAGATATDNCDEEVLVSSDSTFVADCGLTGVWTITYTATDDCGNTATGSQTITIEDTTAPVIADMPLELEVECDSIPEAEEGEATDACGSATVSMVETPLSGGCQGALVRVYTATDECGNTAEFTQIVNIIDTTPPSVICPADVTASCEDNTSVAVYGIATATDNCGDVEITWSNEVEPLCGGASIIYRTFVATDDCGNTASCTQTITKLDTTAPEFGAIEAFINVECDAIPAPADVTATDNCGDATVTVEDAQFSGGCQGAFERVYTATDDCGNTAVFTQIVNVFDNTAPSITCPADVEASCEDNTSVAVYGIATATDNCGDVEITWSNEVESLCGGASIIYRTFVATDDCGNTATCTQTITKMDTTAPEFDNTLADATVECDSVPDAEILTASDNCGDATVSMLETSAGTCPTIITRTYTATDACDNTAVHVQTLTVVDTTNPVLSSLPADAEVSCDAIPAMEVLTASDNCDADVTVVTDETQIGAGCDYTIERTYTATDACGNSAVHVQTLTVLDTEAPVFDAATVPADATVQCDAIPAPAAPEASDNCAALVSIALVETETPGQCDGEKSIIRTWTANDGCGNTTIASQTILVIDTTAPEFDAEVADETYTCGDEIPAAPALTATDNCSSAVSVELEEVIEGNTNPNLDCDLTTGQPSDALGSSEVWSMFLQQAGSTEQDYYVLDGNGASFTETDLGAGVFEGHLTGTLVDAGGEDQEAFLMDIYLIGKTNYDGWTGQLTLGNPSVPREAKTFNGVANPGDELDWDYWVIDNSRSQLIGIDLYAGDILELNHAPTNLLFGVEVGMNANNYSEGFGIGGWFTYSGTILGNQVDGQGDIAFTADCPPCEYTITRTWTATDDCGNSTVTSQLITVNAPAGTQQGTDVTYGVLNDDSFGFVSAYPNPTGNTATLVYQVEVDANVNIEVMSNSGKAINTIYTGLALSGTDNYATFDGSDLDNGMYVVKMTTAKEVYYTKVMLLK